jgi:diguanylate cyclase (GGDEF)-like protein
MNDSVKRVETPARSLGTVAQLQPVPDESAYGFLKRAIGEFNRAGGAFRRMFSSFLGPVEKILEEFEERGRKIEGLEKATGDLAARLASTEALLEAAKIDGLTGLPRRDKFTTELNGVLEHRRSDDSGHDPAIFIIDIDHFKKINDTYGHNVGDQALQLFGAHLGRVVRGADTVVRHGGEEFAILIHDSKGVGRILQELTGPFEFAEVNNEKLSMTLSVGVLVLDQTILQEMRGADLVVKIADDRLYAAKNGGRARACVGNDAAGAPRFVSLRGEAVDLQKPPAKPPVVAPLSDSTLDLNM